VLPDLPPQRSAARGWLLAGGAFLLFVAGFAGLLWGLGKLLVRAGNVRAPTTDALVHRWQSPEQRLASIRAALSADEPGLTAAEQRELKRFFDKLRSSLQTPGTGPFLELVDLEAAAERVLMHPASRLRSRTERGLVEQQLQHRMPTPPAWSQFQLIRGERNQRGDELLVYTIVSGPELPPSPVRWWLKRDGRTWRICDWHRIDRGVSQAARFALQGAGMSNSELDAFRRAVDAVRRAEELVDSGHMALAARDLLEAQAHSLRPQVHDMLQIDLASAWGHCGRSDQVLAACAKVRDLQLNPGVHYLRALAYARREDFQSTVASAALYRAAAGRHPHLLEIEAEALEALGRRQEAADCWRQRLALLPDDTTALAEYCRLAPDDAAARASSVFRRTRHPEESALAAGRLAIGRNDDVTYSAVERFFRDADPKSPALEMLAGLAQQQRGERLAAARHFRLAAERANPDERQAHWAQFLTAMASAGRSAQGYLAAPDPKQSLAQLTAGLEFGEAPITPEDLPRLVALHKQRLPGDPRLPYLEGLVACGTGDFAAAEALLQNALPKLRAAAAADDEGADLVEPCLSKLLEARYRQGRLAAAYQGAAGHQAEAFRELARLALEDRNWAAFDELIELHRQSPKHDPWIDYFLALRAREEGDSAAALAAVQRAEASADEALIQTLSWLKNQLLIQAGGVTQAYQASSDPREAFRRLVAHLSAEEDWAGVLELTALHSAQSPRRSTTLYWSAAANWRLGKYQAIIDTLTPWPEDRVGRLDPGQLTELCDLAVRSHLRLGQLRQAEIAADRARDEYGVEPPLVALKLAQGDRAGVLEMIEHPRIARALFGKQLYRDLDLASLATDEELAAVRRRQALPLPSDDGPRNVALVLFFAEPLTPGQLEHSVAKAGASLPAVRLGDWQGRRSLLWDRGPEALVLTTGEGEYCSCDTLPSSLAAGDARRAIIEQHGGWAALDLLRADEHIPLSDLPQLASGLAAALAELRPQALYVVSGRRTRRLEIIDDAAADQLAGDYFASDLTAERPAASDSLYLFPSGDERRFPRPYGQSRQLRQLADAARVGNPAGHALVRVQLRRGHAVEEHWLKIIRSRPQQHGDDEFIAEVAKDSQLWPFLRRGERIRLATYEPLEVRSLDGSALPFK
jgi:hypothetical protein